MMPQSRQEALGRLRSTLATGRPGFDRMVAALPGVLARYQPLFRLESLPKLTPQDFHSFLIFRNNQHWVGLHRKGPEICSDMPRLRAALAVLLDESRPIKDRIDELAPGKRAAVPGMGRAILTAILLVSYPAKYGVWNNRSQGSMELLGLWPEFERGSSFGQRYAEVNGILLGLARDLGTDLWTLDGLWWFQHEDEVRSTELQDSTLEMEGPQGPESGSQLFGLERHLHDFLHDNWEKTSLGRDWDLHSEDGEVVGYEYPTPVGRIDLLARHKREKKWLVVELKRDQSSDSTVGQALRYMGYVHEHVADKGDTVEGMIIAHSGDERISYALGMIPTISLMLYEVDFRLKIEKGKK